MTVNNDFNGKNLYYFKINLINDGNYIIAKDLKVEGTVKTIKNLQVRKNNRVIVHFTNNENDDEYANLESFKRSYSPTTNYIHINQNLWDEEEYIYFYGFEKNQAKVEKKMKIKLAEHCKEEIEKTKKQILQLNKYINTMTEYLEFANK